VTEPPETLPGHDRRSRLLGNRGFLISTASTIVFFAVVTVIFVAAPGFDAVRESFFNVEAMKQSFFGVPEQGIPGIGQAFLLNVRIFLVAEVLILIFALLVAVVRSLPGPVFFPFRLVATVYTDLFRGTPLLLVIYLFGFGLPALGLRGISTQSEVVYATAALVLSYSAYVAEVYRAGIDSVHPSQVAAARSLGLSRFQSLRHVVLPQAIRRIIPPLLNDFVSLQKDTALVGAAGLFDAMFAARDYANFNFNFTPYVVVALYFIVLTIPLARLTDHLQHRAMERERQGAR